MNFPEALRTRVLPLANRDNVQERRFLTSQAPLNSSLVIRTLLEASFLRIFTYQQIIVSGQHLAEVSRLLHPIARAWELPRDFVSTETSKRCLHESGRGHSLSPANLNLSRLILVQFENQFGFILEAFFNPKNCLMFTELPRIRGRELQKGNHRPIRKGDRRRFTHQSTGIWQHYVLLERRTRVPLRDRPERGQN